MSRTPLYPTHIPLNPLQRGAVAFLAAAGALIRWVDRGCTLWG